MRRTVFLAAIMVVFSARAGAQARKSDVIRTPHNLSATGSPVSSSEPDACIFCHTPHSSDVNETPLWNHQMPVQGYTTYTSSTYNSGAGSITSGVSKQCLSCHDGTIALGQTVSKGLISTQGTLSAGARLGTDLTNDHPVGVQPVDDGQLFPALFQSPPATRDPAVKLRAGRIECTSCHEPHTQSLDPVSGNFLVRSNSGGALCLACHDPGRAQPNTLAGWTASAHATSASTVAPAADAGPYGSVAANGCASCHTEHSPTAAASPRLLSRPEESSCANCHGGANVTPAPPNVMTDFSKAYSHPVSLAGQHDPVEAVSPVTNRHAECPDCHNVHVAQGGSAVAPAVEPAVAGASGYNGAGALRPAANEYEVCFKCHADSPNKPQPTAGYTAYGRTAVREADARVADPYNLRLDLASLVSRHNVTSPRVRAAALVPSLRPSMLTRNGQAGRLLAAGTSIYCTDCHASDQARNSTGTGPNGPHGSRWPHLLERRSEQEPPPSGGVAYVAGVNGTADLCDKCHDVAGSILANSSFREHDKHVRGERAACSTCHDPHGVQGGTSANNYALINFDTAIVRPNSSGILRFESSGPGTFHGRCYLSCHGQNHNGLSY